MIFSESGVLETTNNDEDGNEVDSTASSELGRNVGGGLYNDDDDRGQDGGGDEDNHSLDQAG